MSSPRRRKPRKLRFELLETRLNLTTEWDGPGNNFNDADNWTDGVPDMNKDAIFDKTASPGLSSASDTMGLTIKKDTTTLELNGYNLTTHADASVGTTGGATLNISNAQPANRTDKTWEFDHLLIGAAHESTVNVKNGATASTATAGGGATDAVTVGSAAAEGHLLIDKESTLDAVNDGWFGGNNGTFEVRGATAKTGFAHLGVDGVFTAQVTTTDNKPSTWETAELSVGDEEAATLKITSKPSADPAIDVRVHSQGSTYSRVDTPLGASTSSNVTITHAGAEWKIDSHLRVQETPRPNKRASIIVKDGGKLG